MSKMIHKPRSKGFTLIELMIVILIIAILVGIAIPVYLAARRNAQKRTCQANLRTIDGAFNTYMAEAEVFPTSVTAMESGTYQVLKKAYKCPTGNAVYTLTGGGLTTVPPNISCPSPVADAPGHTI